MKRKKDKSNLYSYLAEHGAFDGTCDDATFEILRKNYYRFYKSSWRRLDRQRKHYYSVPISKSLHPFLQSEARKRKMSVTKLLRECTVSYLNETFLLDQETLIEIRVLLSQTYFEIKQGLEGVGISVLVMEEILKLCASRENEILRLLKHPPTLFNAVKTKINEDEVFRQSIVDLLNLQTSL